VKLRNVHVVKKFPAFCKTQTLVKVFTQQHWALPEPVYTVTYHFLKVHFDSILSYTLMSHKWSYQLNSLIKMYFSYFRCVLHSLPFLFFVNNHFIQQLSVTLVAMLCGHSMRFGLHGGSYQCLHLMVYIW
jgi:hypothetical protein